MLGRLRAFNLKRKYGPAIVVVSGLPRSGTSMMMKMLGVVDLAVVTDEQRTPDEDNPKGYFEDERVKHLHETEDLSWLEGCRGKVIKIISYLLQHLPDGNHYKIIFMHRDLEEVIASQNKMLVRRGEPMDDSDAEKQKMIKNYQGHLRKIRFLMEHKPNIEYLDVNYRQVLEEPKGQADRLAVFLGMKLDTDRMAGAVDPALYRNRRT